MYCLPIGSIICFPSPILPDGFQPCDGRELSKKLYPELYKLIKGTWGETANSFFLPDLRGQFVRGWDDGNGVDPDSGADHVRALGSEQIDTFQGHAHDLEIDGKISEASLDYKSNEIRYGTNTFSDNESIKFNSVLTSSESREVSERLNSLRQTYGKLFEHLCGGLLSRKFANGTGITHSHELPTIKVKDASNSTFQKIRVSTETRPKNVALMYCIKVK